MVAPGLAELTVPFTSIELVGDRERRRPPTVIVIFDSASIRIFGALPISAPPTSILSAPPAVSPVLPPAAVM